MVVDGASEPTLCARALDTAVSIAESLRDTGRHVLLIVDSLHDWAAALVAQEDALLLRTQLLCWAAAAHARLGRHCPAASAADNGDVAAGVARALSRSPRTRNAADGNMPSVEAKIVALFARASLRWVQPPALAGTSTSHVHGSLTLLATLAPQDWADGVVVRDAVVRRSLGAARTFWALDAKLRALRHHPSVNWKRSFSNEPPAMLRDNGSAVGARGSDCDYGGRCELVKELLLQEESLWQRAGGDPLAHRPRVTEHESVALATAQMLREDWLQQNIFDPVDFMCPLYKANAMEPSCATYCSFARWPTTPLLTPRVACLKCCRRCARSTRGTAARATICGPRYASRSGPEANRQWARTGRMMTLAPRQNACHRDAQTPHFGV